MSTADEHMKSEPETCNCVSFCQSGAAITGVHGNTICNPKLFLQAIADNR